MMENRLSRAYLEAQSWGPALLREFDLVIAANVFAEMKSGCVLYNDTLNNRIAEFCRPFDRDLQEKCLGIISIPNIDGEARGITKSRLLADLAKYPRGHWAIYELDGGFDSWISNGVGGTSTLSGNKFMHKSADDPLISFERVYATVFSTMSYYRKSEIENEIIFASVEAANLKPGDSFKKVWMKRHEWNATYLGTCPHPQVPSSICFKIRASRRGVKTAEYLLDRKAIFQAFSLSHVMPAAYEDARNESRRKSLSEARHEAAQALWNRVMQPDLPIIDRMKVIREFDRADDIEFDSYASMAPFKVEGDRLSRTAYTQPKDVPGPTFTYSVTFEEGSDRITARSIVSKDELVTTTILDELALHSSSHWADRL
jgi:hypothetical protein